MSDGSFQVDRHLLDELYSNTDADIKSLVERILSLEQANLHYERPPAMGEKIVKEVRLVLPEELS